MSRNSTRNPALLPRMRLLACLLLAAAPCLKAGAEALPDIEAHQFDSTVVRKSSSGRIYLIKTNANDLPKTGNLVLFQSEGKPISAFRVLKTDPSTSEYVAKRIRRYEQAGDLKAGQSYVTIEKVADVVPAPPADGATAAAAASEVADAELDAPAGSGRGRERIGEVRESGSWASKEVYDYDDDLDQTTSPQDHKRSGELQEPIYDEEMDDARTAYEIDEVTRFDPFNNMISVNAGFFRNMANLNLGGPVDNGFSLSYARTLSHQLFAYGKGAQDSLNLEPGLVYYRKISVDTSGDSYTLLPVFANLRYHLFFSPDFAISVYGGVQYNFVMSSESPTQSTLNNLQGPQANVGVGFLYRIGPQWFLRADLGLDRMTAGLSVRW